MDQRGKYSDWAVKRCIYWEYQEFQGGVLAAAQWNSFQIYAAA
jgi:hypothetical protein